MIHLSKSNLQKIAPPGDQLPGENIFSLPERVLQFGTGVLLRALPDYIIDRANRKGLFNGRVVMVKSTDSGDGSLFQKQDGLYTVCIRGIDEGEKVEANHIISSVSRILSASTQWDDVLDTASNPAMQVIISNTTEVGITLVPDNIYSSPPASFPGKLLSFLYRRFKLFGGDATKGMVIIPTELIPGNADKLLYIIRELAHQNNIEASFLSWLENANYFCNSLVDRIVPGKPPADEQRKIEDHLAYKDELMIMAEVYALWAIQSDNEKVKSILSFALQDEGVVIAADIQKFRELKLRLLNGPHTFCCGLAYLAGFKTVKEAMADAFFLAYIKHLMFDEIIPVIAGESIPKNEAETFASKVLDRFRNNFIEHPWLNICLQYSSKMRLRNANVIVDFTNRFCKPPVLMSLGMAAHILFMKTVRESDGKYYGDYNGTRYPVEDQHVSTYADYWKNYSAEILVKKILNDEVLWGNTFSVLPGFDKQVFYWLQLMIQKGVMNTLQEAVKGIGAQDN
jgi:tagaturonate reductase